MPFLSTTIRFIAQGHNKSLLFISLKLFLTTIKSVYWIILKFIHIVDPNIQYDLLEEVQRGRWTENKLKYVRENIEINPPVWNTHIDKEKDTLIFPSLRWRVLAVFVLPGIRLGSASNLPSNNWTHRNQTIILWMILLRGIQK